MDFEARKAEALEGIKELEDGLTSVWHKAIEEDDFEGAVELLQQWKVHAGQFLRTNVSEVEARELQKITRKYPPIRHVGDIDFRIAKYEEILHALIKEIRDDPTILPPVQLPPTPEPATTQDGVNVDSYRPTGKPNIIYANELYDRVKTLIQNTVTLDGNTARVIIQLVEDAIKEFGNTNQEKKVELTQIREQAEEFLPPKTVEELRKRAEGIALKKIHPKSKVLRYVLYTAVILIVIIIAFFAVKKAISEKTEDAKVKPTPTDTQPQSTEQPTQEAPAATQPSSLTTTPKPQPSATATPLPSPTPQASPTLATSRSESTPNEIAQNPSDVRIGVLQCVVGDEDGDAGNGLRGATCIARNQQTKEEYTGNTNANGLAIITVPYGSYVVTIKAPRYSTQVMATTLGQDGFTTVEVRLQKIQ